MRFLTPTLSRRRKAVKQTKLAVYMADVMGIMTLFLLAIVLPTLLEPTLLLSDGLWLLRVWAYLVLVWMSCLRLWFYLPFLPLQVTAASLLAMGETEPIEGRHQALKLRRQEALCVLFFARLDPRYGDAYEGISSPLKMYQQRQLERPYQAPLKRLVCRARLSLFVEPLSV